MGLKLVLTIIGIAFGAIVFQKLRRLVQVKEVPKLNLNAYWGRGDVSTYREDSAIKKFKIEFESKALESLTTKLHEPLWLPEPLEGTTFEYGINVKELRSVMEYWRDSYLPRWNERLDFLNSLPQFTTQIQGLNVHFIHAKPSNTEGKKVIPMLLLHGWPGSVREFYQFIPMLTAPNEQSDIAFEVIAPSLPGYAWSDASAKKHFGPAEMAVVLRNLMLRLGHNKFIVQGGDWGSIIGSMLTTLFPENVLAYHSNFCLLDTPLSWFKLYIASWWPTKFIDSKYVDFVFPMRAKIERLIEGTGYLHIQATKPETIGVALTRNPVGLTAYLLEKFSLAFEKYDKDAILDNIMIYYLTDCITSSFRLYAEGFSKKQREYEFPRIPTHVPSACARFRRDLSHQLDWQLKDKYTNLVQSTWYVKGGHFAAWEDPELLYDDFIAFTNKVFSNRK